MSSNEKSAGIVPLDEERRRRQQAGAANDLDQFQNLDSAGAMLAAARQSRGFSIEDVAARTNFTEKRVQDIEEMHIGELPAASFTLGFVRTYAKLLDLPVDPLVERFREEANYPGKNAMPTMATKVDKDLGAPAQVSLFAVMVVICVIAYIVWQILQVVASDEPVAPPDGFPLAMNEQAETPVVYEAEAQLEQSPNAGPSSGDNAAPEEAVSDPEGIATTDASAEDTELAGLSEIERLQRSIQPDDPMVLVPGPQPPMRKPTPAELVAAAEARRLAAIEAAQAAALAAETLDAEAEADLGDDPSAEDTANRADDDNLGSASDAESEETVAADAATEAAEAAETAIPADDEIIAPVRTLAIAPVYPVRCEKNASDEEFVTISYRVSRFGKVVGPEVSQSSNSCFNRSALSAVARWDFTPAQKAGRSVTSDPLSTRIMFNRP